MSKITFIYIAVFVFLLQIEQLEYQYLDMIQFAICGFLIMTLGISHGGIDNILHQNKTNSSDKLFIPIYIIAGLVNASLWFIFPNLAFFLFILISAYHFGQSQFVEYRSGISSIDKLLYFSWGLTLLFGLIHFNKFDVLSSDWYGSITIPLMSFMLEYSVPLFMSVLFITISVMLFKLVSKEISIQDFFLELFQIFLICFTFKTFSVIVGFTMYFIILHSLRVLNHEYKYLKAKSIFRSNFEFVKLLMPFTLLSIVGIILIISGIVFFNVNISYALLALILTSSVTMPHSYVMEIFYNNNKAIRVH